LQRRSYYFLLFVIGLGLFSGVLFTKFKTIYGLDIKGGTRLTYQVDLKDNKEITMESARPKIITILTSRASGMAAEPVVAAKGEDQIVVEIPGISDAAKAQEIIGSSARIELYHAKNLITEDVRYRDYIDLDSDKSKGAVVTFSKTGDSKEILPGTPEYKQVIAGWSLILAGPDLAEAGSQPGAKDTYQPTMSFSSDGAKKMKRWSDIWFGKGEKIAFVLDGKVLSVSPVQKDASISNNAYINGDFSAEYVKNLTELLNAGSLPADLKLLGSSTVSPTIGEAAYTKMVTAGAIAFALIGVYLIAYYSFPGFVALIALVLYTLFTLTALKFIGATFSLAAIAGFILSVGMAVDANILVFERFKEEMRGGRPLRVAIEIGFKRALPAIIDSNACTILTSLVLASLGTGPVKGFATTLIIGVIISLFTAVTVTRSLLIFLTGSGVGNDPKWYAIDRDWFGKFIKGDTILPVVQKYKKWFLISLVTSFIGLPFMFMGGIKQNVELTGGSEVQYQLKSAMKTEEIVSKLETAGFKGATVKFGDGNIVIVSVQDNEKFKTAKDDGERASIVATAGGFSDGEFKGITTVGPTLQKEVQLSALKAVLGSIGLIIIYLAFRFGFSVGGFKEGIKFGVSAIGALFHDILVVISMAAVVGFIFHWDISSLFLTALLTIIGFSVHDTIVIFDRFRENLRHPEAGEDLEHLMNKSITQTFSRSLNTSGTVLVTLLILIVFGTSTPELKFFVTAMLIGIASGTYSSIYNASPILYLWDKAIVKKKGEKFGLIGLARSENSRAAAGVSQYVPRETANTSTEGRSYGQVRRRAKDPVKESWREID
jgi:SecD/SecF fusion protein